MNIYLIVLVGYLCVWLGIIAVSRDEEKYSAWEVTFYYTFIFILPAALAYMAGLQQ